MAYVVVLWIELAPFILGEFTDSRSLPLRRFARSALPSLRKASIWIIALGMVLPTMHQSSLGTLMLLANSRIHELWRTPMVPLFFLLTCISMGYAVVVFESAFSSVAFGRKPETRMLADVAAVIAPLQIVVVILRLADMAMRGVLGSAVRGRCALERGDRSNWCCSWRRP